MLTGKNVVGALETIIFGDLGQEEVRDSSLLVWLLPEDVLKQEAVQQAHTVLATGVCRHLCSDQTGLGSLC